MFLTAGDHTITIVLFFFQQFVLQRLFLWDWTRQALLCSSCVPVSIGHPKPCHQFIVCPSLDHFEDDLTSQCNFPIVEVAQTFYAWFSWEVPGIYFSEFKFEPRHWTPGVNSTAKFNWLEWKLFSPLLILKKRLTSLFHPGLIIAFYCQQLVQNTAARLLRLPWRLWLQSSQQSGSDWGRVKCIYTEAWLQSSSSRIWAWLVAKGGKDSKSIGGDGQPECGWQVTDSRATGVWPGV